MQRKKSQHNETLKESFEKINSFEEILRYALEILTRNNEMENNIKMYRNKAYPKAKHGHGFSSLETPL
jgi:hypothetical protein